MSTKPHQTVDDTKRYVELARAGWTDPEINQLKLIEELLQAHEAIIAEEREKAKEEAEEEHDAAEAARSFEEWLDGLREAHEREVEKIHETYAASLRAEIDQIRAELARLTMMRERSRDDDSSPTPTPGKRRGVSPRRR